MYSSSNRQVSETPSQINATLFVSLVLSHSVACGSLCDELDLWINAAVYFLCLTVPFVARFLVMGSGSNTPPARIPRLPRNTH